MKLYNRILIALLALCLLAGGLSALAAGLEKPDSYIGSWAGGEDYSEAHEYYLDLLDYSDGVYTASLSIYRIWSFDDMTALLTPDAPSAVLSTGPSDDFSVMGTLDFDGDVIHLLILESNYPDLLPDTEIVFERASFD